MASRMCRTCGKKPMEQSLGGICWGCYGTELDKAAHDDDLGLVLNKKIKEGMATSEDYDNYVLNFLKNEGPKGAAVADFKFKPNTPAYQKTAAALIRLSEKGKIISVNTHGRKNTYYLPRFAPKNPNKNKEVPKKLMQFLERNPTKHFTLYEVSKQMGLKSSTAASALKLLYDKNLVNRTYIKNLNPNHNHKKVYAYSSKVREEEPPTNHPVPQLIIDFLEETPEKQYLYKEILEGLEKKHSIDLNPSTVSSAISVLIKDGVIGRTSIRPYLYHAKPIADNKTEKIVKELNDISTIWRAEDFKRTFKTEIKDMIKEESYQLQKTMLNLTKETRQENEDRIDSQREYIIKKSKADQKYFNKRIHTEVYKLQEDIKKLKQEIETLKKTDAKEIECPGIGRQILNLFKKGGI